MRGEWREKYTPCGERPTGISLITLRLGISITATFLIQRKVTYGGNDGSKHGSYHG